MLPASELSRVSDAQIARHIAPHADGHAHDG